MLSRTRFASPKDAPAREVCSLLPPFLALQRDHSVKLYRVARYSSQGSACGARLHHYPDLFFPSEDEALELLGVQPAVACDSHAHRSSSFAEVPARGHSPAPRLKPRS